MNTEAMSCSFSLPAECVGCSTDTVMRINGQPVCRACIEREPPDARVLERLLGTAC